MPIPIDTLPHQRGGVGREVVEVASQVNVVLARRPELNDDRRPVDDIHTIYGAGRRVQDSRGLGLT